MDLVLAQALLAALCPQELLELSSALPGLSWELPSPLPWRLALPLPYFQSWPKKPSSYLLS